MYIDLQWEKNKTESWCVTAKKKKKIKHSINNSSSVCDQFDPRWQWPRLKVMISLSISPRQSEDVIFTGIYLYSVLASNAVKLAPRLWCSISIYLLIAHPRTNSHPRPPQPITIFYCFMLFVHTVHVHPHKAVSGASVSDMITKQIQCPIYFHLLFSPLSLSVSLHFAKHSTPWWLRPNDNQEKQWLKSTGKNELSCRTKTRNAIFLSFDFLSFFFFCLSLNSC